MELSGDPHGKIEQPAWTGTVHGPDIVHWRDGYSVDWTPVRERDSWTRLLELSQHHRAERLAYCYSLKRCIDAFVAVLALVLLSPVLFIVTLSILITMGRPVFFCQTRIGRAGQPFDVYKFRTMIRDRRRGSHQFDGIDRRRTHKCARDPRVTPVGRILRRTSLDELPQLLNVLRGEMAIVGPRPELPEIVARYEPWQHRRHLVRPGLTGWWQVQGRSDRPMHENTELDIYYVENLSPGLDLRIIARTFRVVLSGFGAI